jgi:hypothetical protein
MGLVRRMDATSSQFGGKRRIKLDGISGDGGNKELSTYVRLSQKHSKITNLEHEQFCNDQVTAVVQPRQA